MSIFVIILLILLGIVLFLIEFFLIPGVTIAGIGGAILIGAGIYMAFTVHGATTGILILLGSISGSILILLYSLRAKTWSRFTLHATIDGKSNEDDVENKVNIGDAGKSTTRLAPSGNILINGLITEARSTGGFIDENSEVTVIKIENGKLIVKLKNI